MSHGIRVKFVALLAPGSTEALNHLIMLPKPGMTVDECKGLVPSMLPRCADPSQECAGVQWAFGGSERVAPVGAEVIVSPDCAHFLLSTSPAGFVKQLGDASEGGNEATAIALAEVARLEAAVRGLTGDLSEQERKIKGLQSSLEVAEAARVRAVTDADSARQKALEAAKKVSEAEAAKEKAEKAAKAAADKSEVIPLQRRNAELEAQIVELKKAPTSTATEPAKTTPPSGT